MYGVGNWGLHSSAMSGERRMAMARSVEELLGLGFDRSSVEIACTDE